MSERDYKFVVIDDETCPTREMLRQPSAEVPFPLSDEHRHLAEALLHLMEKENAAGLAASQIGHNVQMFAFQVEEIVFQYRQDVEAIVPPTILINGKYTPLSEETRVDWEACFSVKDTMAEVRRYTYIRYEGFDMDGKPVSVEAKGFLARLLQHEIDHTEGILFIDRLEPGSRSGPMEEMRKIRLQELEEWRATQQSSS